jgi:hypothetical protein
MPRYVAVLTATLILVSAKAFADEMLIGDF